MDTIIDFQHHLSKLIRKYTDTEAILGKEYTLIHPCLVLLSIEMIEAIYLCLWARSLLEGLFPLKLPFLVGFCAIVTKSYIHPEYRTKIYYVYQQWHLNMTTCAGSFDLSHLEQQ